MRHAFVLLHRYIGLVMAFFLVIAGITGAVLVWYEELDGMVLGELHKVQPPSPSAAMLDAVELHARVQTALPQARADWVPLKPEAGHAAVFWLEPKTDAVTGQDIELPFDEVFVNPYTGDILGWRTWGDISEGSKNLLPFLYRLHYSLALGTIGTTLFGIIALLWTLDCFIGFSLTLPRNRPFWQKWRPAWGIKRKRLNYDAHRAGGLWPWALLFVLAWSSVGFNLHEVYSPVTKLIFDYRDHWAELPNRPTPLEKPTLDFSAALERGRMLAGEEAARHGFVVKAENTLQYQPRSGLYRYRVTSDRDIHDHGGGTQIWFDGNTGDLINTILPTGQYSGNTVTNWLFALHMASVWGLPYRVLVCLVGLVVAMLSVTGIVIWWRKRKARVVQYAKRPAQPSGSAQDGLLIAEMSEQ